MPVSAVQETKPSNSISTLSSPNANPTLAQENQRRESDDNELMQVDDTKNRVYIHNLDEEIAAIEAEEGEERLIFLPDIEEKLKRLGKTPERLLRPEIAPPQVRGNEMVLYQVPTSLSVPVERDSVRKAILESRARAREEQEQASRDSMLHDVDLDHDHGQDAPTVEDDDAMDIG